MDNGNDQDLTEKFDTISSENDSTEEHHEEMGIGGRIKFATQKFKFRKTRERLRELDSGEKKSRVKDKFLSSDLDRNRLIIAEQAELLTKREEFAGELGEKIVSMERGLSEQKIIIEKSDGRFRDLETGIQESHKSLHNMKREFENAKIVLNEKRNAVYANIEVLKQHKDEIRGVEKEIEATRPEHQKKGELLALQRGEVEKLRSKITKSCHERDALVKEVSNTEKQLIAGEEKIGALERSIEKALKNVACQKEIKDRLQEKISKEIEMISEKKRDLELHSNRLVKIREITDDLDRQSREQQKTINGQSSAIMKCEQEWNARNEMQEKNEKLIEEQSKELDANNILLSKKKRTVIGRTLKCERQQAQIADNGMQLERMEAELDSLEHEVQKQHDDIKNSYTQIEEGNRYGVLLREKVESLRGIREVNHGKLQILGNDLAQINDSITQTKVIRTTCEDKVQKQTIIINEKTTQKETLLKEIAHCKKKIDDYEDKIRDNDEMLLTVYEKINKSDERLEDLKCDIGERVKEFEAREDDLKEKEGYFKYQNSEIEELKAQINELKCQHDVQTSILEEKTGQISEQNERGAGLKEERNGWQKELARLAGELERIQTSIEEKHQECTNYGSQIDNGRTKRKELLKEIDKRLRDAAKVEETRVIKEEESKKQQVMLDGLEEKIRGYVVSKAKNKELIFKLKDAINTGSEELSTYKGKIEKYVKEVLNQKSVINAKSIRLTSLQAIVDKGQKELNEQTNAVTENENDLRVQEEMIVNMTRKIEEQKRRILVNTKQVGEQAKIIEENDGKIEGISDIIADKMDQLKMFRQIYRQNHETMSGQSKILDLKEVQLKELNNHLDKLKESDRPEVEETVSSIRKKRLPEVPQ